MNYLKGWFIIRMNYLKSWFIIRMNYLKGWFIIPHELPQGLVHHSA